MTTASRARCRGNTVIEIVITLAIGLTAIASFSGVMNTTGSVVRDAQAATRATAEHRRNLTALADALRTAEVLSLDGFAVDGTSTQPSFQRVTGRNGRDPIFGPVETLEWRARPHLAVDGVAQPGSVWLASPDGDVLLADRVPAGGFSVRQDGRVLSVLLTTYAPKAGGEVQLITGSVAVTVRN